MPNYKVILPSKPKVMLEEGNKGIFEIENLYRGYGYTLGNALRRIILSSLPGAAITSVKIEGVSHEFSTISGVKEDVISILLNLKKLSFKMSGDDMQIGRLKVDKTGKVTASSIELPGQIEIADKSIYIAEITDKKASLDIEMTIERGIGYAPKESLHREKMDVGMIALDASFTAVKKVSFEVENMRVGDRTDFNRLRIMIETDGLLTPREALEKSIEILINQLKAIVGFQEDVTLIEHPDASNVKEDGNQNVNDKEEGKTKIEDLDLSSRTSNALAKSGIKTLAGLTRKTEQDIVAIEGLGAKALNEIKDFLNSRNLKLKS